MKSLYSLDSYLLEHTRALRIAILLAVLALILLCAATARADDTEPTIKPIAVILTACTQQDDKGRVVLIAIDVLMSDQSIQHFDKGDPNALLASLGDIPHKVRMIDCSKGTTG